MSIFYDLTHPFNLSGKKLTWAIGMYVALIVDTIDFLLAVVEHSIGFFTGGASEIATLVTIGEIYEIIATLISMAFFGLTGIIPIVELLDPTDIADGFVPSLLLTGMYVYYYRLNK